MTEALRMRRGRVPVRWGWAAAAAYVVLAAVSFHLAGLPVRPLYDGAVIGPYRFVNPPRPLAEFNRSPFAFESTFPLSPGRSEEFTAATQDNQAAVSFPEGIVRPRPGDTGIEVRIDPLDPATVGSPPPGTGYDGNAYRITARYMPSQRPVELLTDCPAGTQPGASPTCLTVIVHYAFGPVQGRGTTSLFRKTESGWAQVTAKDFKQLLHMFGSTSELGVFAAAGPNRPSAGGDGGFPVPLAVVLAAGAVVAGVGVTRLPRLLSRA